MTAQAATARRIALAMGSGRLLLPGLLVLLTVALLVELLLGAVVIPPGRMLELLTGAAPTQREAAVLWQIRLPRGALAIAIGAALGLAGAAQQGLFRNPLADPALIGVSSGAALAAVTAIVLGERIGTWLVFLPAGALVPLFAFGGGLAATLLALRLSRAAGPGGEGTGSLLLAGIAVNAVCAAGTGLLITVSDDRQLRDIIFWTMGSLATGGWYGAAGAGIGAVLALAVLLPAARALDALLLGEQEAAYLGIRVDRLRLMVVIATALAVGATVAAAGVIGFVGLVVPHLVRLIGGPRHGLVLPGAALLGAALLLLSDAASRVLAAPAELPIGLVTSALGGPFFIALLLRRGRGAA
ncbi:MAG: iron ABC transporter permease [Acetobacteraceae bacterium]